VDLVKTLSLVSSLLQTFYFCFCLVLYILYTSRRWKTICLVGSQSIHGSPKRTANFYSYRSKIL